MEFLFKNPSTPCCLGNSFAVSTSNLHGTRKSNVNKENLQSVYLVISHLQIAAVFAQREITVFVETEENNGCYSIQ